jgi:hypothetical protein
VSTGPGKVTVKVTFVEDDNPDLFAAVMRVSGLRRRAARIRGLVGKGLLVENAGVKMQTRHDDAKPQPSGDSVDRMLDWSVD